MSHKRAHTDLTADFVRQIFDYDEGTGLLKWRVTLSRRAPAGSVAGFKDDQGRIKLGICGREYMAHRVIWLLKTGSWPEFEVDHRDENKSNNRWKNLRHATSSQNHRNRGKQKNNTSGYKGVTFDRRRGCWIAGVKLDGYRHNLGSFDAPEKAYAAYCEAARRLHGEDWMKT